MRIAIIGAGAIGGLFGFYLAEQAELVLVDAWPAHVAAITAHGLRCERDGRHSRRAVTVTLDPSTAFPADVALVLVKARQMAWAISACKRALAPYGVAYTLQNGLGNYELLADALGPARAGQGVTTLGATLLEPGAIRHAGMGPTILGASPALDLAEALAELLNTCGLPTTVSEQITSLVWGKLLVNVGINALTALLRVPNGALVTTSSARALLTALVEEAATVAAVAGVALPYKDPVAHVLAVAEATASNQSSMLQDILRSVPSEVGVINGAIAREGARLGVATPLNAALTALVEAFETSSGLRIG